MTDGDSKPALLVNERETPKGLLVSVCDSDLLGQEFENGSVSLTVSPEFYDGDKADEETVISSLSRCTTANIVGTRAVNLAIEHGLIDEESVLDLDGTRHAQLLWL